MVERNGGLLSPYRVLDLADEQGDFCGKVLGDLGADVIKIEPPGGSPSRKIGPFFHDTPDPDKSLRWFACNTSKRGITLNIETKEGKEIFNRLVKTADFIIESFPPGFMDNLGLGYSALSRLNQRIILTSITPFGHTGPYKGYKGGDLIATALGGLMYVCGEPGKYPLRCTAEQAPFQAGIQAALGTMIAHHYREITGIGQWIDVSVMECMTMVLWNTLPIWDLNRVIYERMGSKTIRAASRVAKENIFACKDGYVSFTIIPGQWGRRVRILVEWMDEEGMAGDLKKVKWEEIGMDGITQAEMSVWEETFSKFFLKHTRKELHENSVKRGFMLFPLDTVEDLVKDNQLAARDFWTAVEHHELETSLIYPGAPFKANEILWEISRRAPLIGEHNPEIYREEMGFSEGDILDLREKTVI